MDASLALAIALSEAEGGVVDSWGDGTAAQEASDELTVALRLSMEEQSKPAPSVSTAHAALPTGCAVEGVTPGGWCFYEAFLKHLEVPAGSEIDHFGLATAMLENLAERRGDFEDSIAMSDDEILERSADVMEEELYQRVCEQLGPFDIYILDKLEVCLERRNVLDVRHYADDAEIRAWLETCGLSMMRLLPPDSWTASSVGSWLGPGGEYVNLASVVEMHEIAQTRGADLRLMHHQTEDYEHYDVLILGDSRSRLPETANRRVLDRLSASRLAAALLEGSHVTFRTQALELLGKVVPEEPPVDDDESEEDAGDADGSESLASSLEARSEVTGDADGDGDADDTDEESVPPPPPPAPATESRPTRISRAALFCASFSAARVQTSSAAVHDDNDKAEEVDDNNDEDDDDLGNGGDDGDADVKTAASSVTATAPTMAMAM